jgi:hypothetical protein
VPFGPLVLAAALAVASPSPGPHAVVIPPPFFPGSYTVFTAGATRQSGLFDVLTKNDQIYFDLSAKNLDTTYVIEAGIARGIGNAFTGRALDALPVRFVRQDARILWEVPNANFIAPKTPTEKIDLDQSIAEDSVIASTPILAEDKVTGRIVIATTPLLGDFEHVAALLSPHPTAPAGLIVLQAAGGYGLNAAETYPIRAKAFPANVDVLVNLGFTAPANAPPSIPDARGFALAIHYSFIALPQNQGYVPRLADDRVGYFDDTLKDLNDAKSATPFVHFIERWDLRRKPIVFYMTNEVPTAYRESVRQGILAWNAAFAKIGVHDAVEVRDQPADPAFDPDDARYSTIRWITSDTPNFGAYTGVYSDPYTGEIYRAEIVVDGEYMRTVRSGYQENVAPAVTESDEAAAAAQAGYAMVAARTLGYHLDADRFVAQFVQAEVMHETGHAFGLRHNFAASGYYSLAQINNAAFTSVHGISASVMDYLPVNIAPPNVRQGAYFQLNVGPYDDWAIAYGYASAADSKRVARLSADPAYRYGTDENGTAFSPDPRIAPFDLSADPLGWDDEQLALTAGVLGRLDARFDRSGGSYFEERLAFLSALQNELRTALGAARFVGGEYTSRTHRGEAGGSAPFTPISRETSHRAFVILARSVFAPNAFRFSPQLVRDLGSDSFNGWGITTPNRPDIPLVSIDDVVQGTVLNQLFNTINVARIYDIESSAKPGTTMRLQDLFEWTRDAAFAGALTHPNAASPAHRELQRQYLDLMIAYFGAPSQLIQSSGVPRESQALARYELEQIDRTVRVALRSSSLDITTRAHFEDLDARAQRALHGVNVLQP